MAWWVARRELAALGVSPKSGWDVSARGARAVSKRRTRIVTFQSESFAAALA